MTVDPYMSVAAMEDECVEEHGKPGCPGLKGIFPNGSAGKLVESIHV